MKNAILLTFDLEEFDLPLEYNINITEEEQYAITNQGLVDLLILLGRHNIRATFFTTASYAGTNKEIVRNIAGIHEVASHSLRHSTFSESDPLESKSALELISEKPVNGFRRPRFAKVNMEKLKSFGYKYDSSINPVFLPGRYNYLSANRRINTDKASGLIEVPISAVPVLRVPLFWLSFKNLPFSIYLILCRITLKKDFYLHLCFHPWEFANLEKFKIPHYIKRISGNEYLDRLGKLIGSLKDEGEFMTVSDFINSGTWKQ